MADKYMLRVTAGSDYDEANQKLVYVNTEQPIKISNPKLDASLTVRFDQHVESRRKKEPTEMKGSEDKPIVVSEGADGDGVEARKKAGLPDEANARKKHFLKEQHLKDFTFEEGRNYSCDFFNPYLDFNDFTLKLPGFSYIPGITIPIISYWDGQPLRYVLKDRSTNEVLFVIIFTLLPRHSEGKKEEAKKEDKAGQNDEDLD
ncbi:unnamed protein product [Aureobasidium pullulans]|nr:unnamed protein product [Aureobasidium pullulans]